MPRVSPEHLDERRRQILAAARRCFVRNGFHGTSMQDVFAESGLSAGAVYRYFAGKEEIIGAIAANALGELGAAVQALLADDAGLPLEEAVGRILATLERLDDEHVAPVAVQTWGESLRSPALAALVEETVVGVTEVIRRLVAAYRERGQLPDGVSDEQLAKLLVAVMQGFAVRHAVLGDVDAGEFEAALGALLRAG